MASFRQQDKRKKVGIYNVVLLLASRSNCKCTTSSCYDIIQDLEMMLMRVPACYVVGVVSFDSIFRCLFYLLLTRLRAVCLLFGRKGGTQRTSKRGLFPLPLSLRLSVGGAIVKKGYILLRVPLHYMKKA